MEKFIIVAGSPNSGKTISTNMVIEKLIANGAIIDEYPTGSSVEFWKENNMKKGGTVILGFNGKRIAIITYGDTVGDIEPFFKLPNVLTCDVIICCSHATRGRKVFTYFHNYIKTNIDLTKTKIVPIHKNFLCGDQHDVENECTANLIIDLL
ncbi:MAG: hypothetical protein K2J89_02435 [Clostridia bacterium]|nr:hypothetical protein [Clostridia bacterium]